jgi:hypothetical protein
VLGVPRGATREQIRRAYLHLARQHHPDHHHGPAGEDGRGDHADSARMLAINEAWRVLGDARLRRSYDQELARREPPPDDRPPPEGWTDRAAFSHVDWDRWESELAGEEPAEDGIRGTMVHRLLRVLPFVVFGLVLLAIFVFTGVAKRAGDPVIRSATVVGSCLLIEEAGFRPTPCNAPNDGTVVEVVAAEAPCGDPKARRYEPPEGTAAFCLVDNLDSR